MAAAFLSSILWGGAYVAMKFSLDYFHPLSLIFLRLALASCVGLLFLPAMRSRQTYTKGDWRIFLALTLSEPCLYFIFEGYALKYTSASQAGMLVSTLPIFVGILAYILLKEKISRTGWAGGIIAIAGAVWLSLGAVADEHAPDPLLGNALEACAMLFAAIYAICVRRLARGYTAFFITSVQAWGGALFFLPAVLPPFLLKFFSPHAFFLIFLSAFFPYSVWMYFVLSRWFLLNRYRSTAYFHLH